MTDLAAAEISKLKHKLVPGEAPRALLGNGRADRQTRYTALKIICRASSRVMPTVKAWNFSLIAS
jgi:hypothetical protein